MCPNCREEVPKTLYCLNCGYPLYKIELDRSTQEEDVSVEVEPEPFSLEPLTEPAGVEGVTIDVEDLAVTPVVEETEESETEPELEAVTEPVDAVEPLMPEATEAVVEAEQELETFELTEEDIEPEEEIAEPAMETVEAATEFVAEEEAESMEEEAEATETPEAVEEPPEETIVEVPVAEPAPVFEPEPVIREVMENLSKNISMKIKLVNLLQEGGVKIETFNRLFESYVTRGELLMNSRNEMLERVRFDLDSMERALNEAKIGLEELKIRKAIGDASEEEYRAKSPGFEWDIRQYEDEVAKKKAEMVYLEDLNQVMSTEEISELKEKGESGCGAMEGLADAGKISSETATSVKVALEEALAYLKVSC